jgi:predicted nucleotidyltransferase
MRVYPRVHRIVAAQQYPLLFATICGAHPCGFLSPGSDFDLRGPHVLALERVIGLMVRAERVVGFRDVMRKDKGAGEKAER